MWYAQIIGYFFAVFIGGKLIAMVSDSMWTHIGWNPKNDTALKLRPHVWQPRITGLVERVLYVATIQFGKAEFVGIWLALKVAGQWSRWSKDPKEDEEIPQGRAIYQNFLIGSGLSVLYALVGAQMIEWISSGQKLRAVIVSGTLVYFTLLLWYWLEKYLPRSS